MRDLSFGIESSDIIYLTVGKDCSDRYIASAVEFLHWLVVTVDGYAYSDKSLSTLRYCVP